MLVNLNTSKRVIRWRVTIVITGLLFIGGLVGVVAGISFSICMLLFGLCFVGIMTLMKLDDRPSPVRRNRYINE